MGTYSKHLQQRLRIGTPRVTKADPFRVVVPPHPQKYPKHQGSKGSVYGGFCNRTACTAVNAIWFNTMTHGYYCQECARGIDYRRDYPKMCVMVNTNLSHEYMNALTKAHYKDMVRHNERQKQEQRP